MKPQEKTENKGVGRKRGQANTNQKTAGLPMWHQRRLRFKVIGIEQNKKGHYLTKAQLMKKIFSKIISQHTPDTETIFYVNILFAWKIHRKEAKT